jgi:asparaginyl-tRNA synthetase
MLEPECAFADVFDMMDLGEEYIKYCISYALKNNMEDLLYFQKTIDRKLIERLTKLCEEPFKRITYTEAVEILQSELKRKKKRPKFEFPVEWGLELHAEHERYLTEVYFRKAVMVTGYPKKIKAFYMRQNDDGKTVAALDVLVPKVELELDLNNDYITD